MRGRDPGERHPGARSLGTALGEGLGSRQALLDGELVALDGQEISSIVEEKIEFNNRLALA